MIAKNVKRIAAALTAVLVLFVSSCAAGGNKRDSGLPLITVTSFPLYDMVENLVGENAEVVCLLPPGAESHDFDPSIKDIGNVADSALFVYCGNGLEEWAESLFESAGGNAVAVDVSVGTELMYQDSGDHEDTDHNDHGHTHGADPHLWTSPENMIKMAAVVYDALNEIGLADEELYDSYNALLGELDERTRSLSAKQSENGKTLFFGDAFAFLYLMKDYDFKYVSTFPGCSDDVEPSIARISEVTKLIAAEPTPPRVIFRAERSEGKIAVSLAETVGAEVLELHSCHNLTAEEYDAGETYFSLMSRNLDNIEKALS